MKKIMVCLIALIPITILFVIQMSATIISQTTHIYVDNILFKNPHFNAENNVETINYDGEVITVDCKANVIPKLASNKAVVYEIVEDSNNIASITDQGLATFSGLGEVTVKITSVDGQKTRECKFLITSEKLFDININTPPTTMKKNETFTFQISPYPAEAIVSNISYTSSKQNVVMAFPNGIIKALGQGTTTITVTATGKNSDNTITKTFDIACVNENTVTKVTDIQIENKEELYVTSKNNFKFPQYAILPTNATNKNITFQSLNEDIASIKPNGEVNFLQKGYVSFRILSNDNETIFEDIKVLYTAGHPLTIDINPKNITVDYQQNGTIDLTTTLTPADADLTNVTYFSSNTEVVKVENNKFYIVGGGTTQLSAVSTRFDDVEIKAVSNITVIRKAEEIKVTHNNQAIKQNEETNLKEYSFTYEILPLDTTNKDVTISSSNQNAIIEQNSNNCVVTFKNTCTTTITISNQASSITKSFDITYTPAQAETIQIDNKIKAVEVNYANTQSFSLLVDNSLSNNSVIYNIKNNNNIVKQNGILFEILKGGTVTIEIIDSKTNDIISTVTITIVRQAKQINVLIDGQKTDNLLTSKKELSFSTTVLPEDTTNKTVGKVIDNTDIADFDGNKIVFKKAGKIEVYFTCGTVKQTVYIESTFAKLKSFSLNNSNIVIEDIGLYKDITTSCIKNITPNDFILKQSDISLRSLDQNIAKIEDNKIVAVSKGTTQIEVEIAGAKTFINLEVQQKTIPVTKIEVVDKQSPYYITSIDSFTVPTVKVYPDKATNKNLIYKCLNTNIASVSTDGQVRFTQKGFAIIRICSADNEEIFEDIKILYTAGHPLQLNIPTTEMTVNFEENKEINLNITLNPTDSNVNLVTLSSSNSDVIKIVKNKPYIVGGGKATITASVVKFDNQTIKDSCEITVIRKAENIVAYDNSNPIIDNISTSLGEYTFTYSVLPADTTNKTVTITSSNQNAVLSYNSNSCIVSFKNSCTTTITILNSESNVSKQFNLTYTIPNSELINISQSTENIDINYNKNKTFNFNVDNNLTQNPIRYNLKVNENVIKQNTDNVTFETIKGGVAVIEIIDTISNDIVSTVNITVIRKALKIDLLLDSKSTTNLLTSKKEIAFETTVSPVDTTNKTVNIVIDQPSIAHISDNKIVFDMAGTINLTFTCDLVNVKAQITSTFGKLTSFNVINSDIVIEDLNLTSTVTASMFNKFTPSDLVVTDDMLSLRSLSPAIATVKGNVITGISKGNTQVEVTIAGSTTFINVEVRQKIIHVTDIQVIDKETYYITQENTFKVPNVQVFPAQATNKNLIYESLTPSIASVSEKGVVSFTEKGYADIKIYSADNEAIFDQIKVLYIANTALSVSLTIDKNQYEYSNNGILNTTVTLFPANANKELVTLTSSNTEVVKVVNNQFVITGGGKATLKATTHRFNNEEISSSCEVTVLRKAEEIVVKQNSNTIKTNFETNLNEVTFNFDVLPIDTTNKDVIITSSNKNATINKTANSFTVSMKNSCLTTIKVLNEESGISKSFDLTYTLANTETININKSSLKATTNYQYGKLINLFVDNSLTFNVCKYNITKNENVVKLSNDGITFEILKGGNITIQILDNISNEIVSVVDIQVIRKANDIDFTIDSKETTNLTTGKKQIDFSAKSLPADATNQTVEAKVSDTTVAEIVGQTIKFKKAGIITLTLTCDEVEKTAEITTTFGSLTSFNVLNDIVLENKGETTTITTYLFDSYQPNDIAISNAMITLTSLNNDIVKVEGRNLVAVAKGTTQVEVEIANTTRLINVEVKQKIEDANLYYNSKLLPKDNQTTLDSLQLSYKVLPENANVQTCTYAIKEGNASITEDGLISFNTTGKVIVVLQADDSNKEFTFTITKTNIFNSMSVLYNDNVVNNNVIKVKHQDIDPIVQVKGTITNLIEENYDLSIFANVSNSITKTGNMNIEVVDMNNGFYKIARTNVSNQSTTTAVTFESGTATTTVNLKFYAITGLKLELNNNDDKNYGLARQRVFANSNYNHSLGKREYTLPIGHTTMPTNLTDKIYWFSDDTSFATVENGVITFIPQVFSDFKYVTITAGNEPNLEDCTFTASYRYTVVNGINIWNFKDFDACHLYFEGNAQSTTGDDIIFVSYVLQTNLTSTQDKAEILSANPNAPWDEMKQTTNPGDASNLLIKGSLYGNGYILNFHNSTSRLVYFETGIISNVTLRQYNFDQSKKSYAGKDNKSFAVGYNFGKPVTIEYSIIENCRIGLELYETRTPIIKNSFIRYCAEGAIMASNNKYYKKIEIYLENVIMEDTGYSAIDLQRGKVFMKGFVDIYNFKSAKDYPIRYKETIKGIMNKNQQYVVKDKEGTDKANITILTFSLGELPSLQDTNVYIYNTNTQQYDEVNNNNSSFARIYNSVLGVANAYAWLYDPNKGSFGPDDKPNPSKLMRQV